MRAATGSVAAGAVVIVMSGTLRVTADRIGPKQPRSG
jgi:hypothetical protein